MGKLESGFVLCLIPFFAHFTCFLCVGFAELEGFFVDAG